MEMPSYGDNDHVPSERGSDEEYRRRVEREFALRSVLDETIVWGMKGKEHRAYSKVMGFIYGPAGVVHATNEEMDLLDEYLRKMKVFNEFTNIVDELTQIINERVWEGAPPSGQKSKTG